MKRDANLVDGGPTPSGSIRSHSRRFASKNSGLDNHVLSISGLQSTTSYPHSPHDVRHTPGVDRILDAQRDKLMARVVYRHIGNQESIVAVHSVNATAGGGGVRWYELRLDKHRDSKLYQEGTYAPSGEFRWMGSPAMDRARNIGIGYSFGGPQDYPGQRFAARLATDPKGVLTLREAVLAQGGAPQTNTLRWEDYSQTAVDPDDDCTIWYVGDYYKPGEQRYSSKIGGFKIEGCR